jgi:hypothetical protein
MLCLPIVSGRPGSLELGLPVSFDLDLESRRVAAPSLGIEGARIERAHGTGVLNIPLGRGGLLFGTIAILSVLLTLALWVLSQLRAVFRTLRDARPFVPANVKRIRWVGVGVILGELAVSGLTYLGDYNTMTHFSAEGIRFVAQPTLDVVAIIHGLVILAIAEVFKAGTRLEDEQSLTI